MGICGIYRKDIIKSNEPARSRTWNLLIRGQMHYLLPGLPGCKAQRFSVENPASNTKPGTLKGSGNERTSQ